MPRHVVAATTWIAALMLFGTKRQLSARIVRLMFAVNLSFNDIARMM